MLDDVVQEVTCGSFADELLRHFIVRAGFLILKGVNYLSIFIFTFSNVNWLNCESCDSHSFLLLGHLLEVDSIVYEWILTSIEEFSFPRKSHVSLTESWVNLLPVEMLLIDYCFHTLWEDAILE